MYICICNAITEKDVKEAEAEGARTHEEVFAHFGTTPQCGCCIEAMCDQMVCPCSSKSRSHAA